MANTILFDEQRRLRNGWWIAAFFLLLASFVFADILLSKQYHFEVNMLHQAIIIVATSSICQLLRHEPFTYLTGAFNLKWIKELSLGIITGMAIMLTPALFLSAFPGINWHINTVQWVPLLTALLLFAGVAVAEEFLFRGFIFQRLISGVGTTGAQLILGALFLLTHLNNPGMTGTVKVLAGLNIFLASLLFGLAFIRTRSLAMALGIHFMANSMQGLVLGFGVSGHEQASILKPVFNDAPPWLTGGTFGLEASVPGLISILIALILMYRWKPSAR